MINDLLEKAWFQSWLSFYINRLIGRSKWYKV